MSLFQDTGESQMEKMEFEELSSTSILSYSCLNKLVCWYNVNIKRGSWEATAPYPANIRAIYFVVWLVNAFLLRYSKTWLRIDKFCRMPETIFPPSTNINIIVVIITTLVITILVTVFHLHCSAPSRMTDQAIRSLYTISLWAFPHFPRPWQSANLLWNLGTATAPTVIHPGL